MKFMVFTLLTCLCSCNPKEAELACEAIEDVVAIEDEAEQKGATAPSQHTIESTNQLGPTQT